MPTSHPSKLNRLLAALPAGDFARYAAHLEPVTLPLGQRLHDAGGQLRHVYFPTTAIASLILVLADGASAEIAVVGNDGAVGVGLLLGGWSTPGRAIVQSAGLGYRLDPLRVGAESDRGGPALRLLVRYSQSLMAQAAQTAICNRHHSVDQQLSRWLLSRLDRLPDLTLGMTQELISSLLGVRREGVTEAAGKLQHAGVIRYCRGRIEVLDRIALEAQACECYEVLRREDGGWAAVAPGSEQPRAGRPAAGPLAVTARDTDTQSGRRSAG